MGMVLPRRMRVMNSSPVRPGSIRSSSTRSKRSRSAQSMASLPEKAGWH